MVAQSGRQIKEVPKARPGDLHSTYRLLIEKVHSVFLLVMFRHACTKKSTGIKSAYLCFKTFVRVLAPT